MEALDTLVIRAQEGDLDAYGQIVRRFQDMAVGYAYSVLGDFHLAEDAAQEAFIRVYLDRSRLREAAAFPSWFRKIVFTCCDRLTRGKRIPTIPLEDEIVSEAPNPDEIAETQEMKDRVLRAVRGLPEREREVTTLFYINGYSQNEIGAFLEVPAKTVKSRLHTARNRLRERMMDMVKEHLHEQRPSKDEDFAVRVIEDLVQLSDWDLRDILGEVGIEDLAVALRGTSEDLQARIFSNVPKGVREVIQHEMAFSRPAVPGDVEAVRARIVELVQQKAPGERANELTEGYLAMKQALKHKLQRTPISRFRFDEIAEMFSNIGTVAMSEDRLAWEELAECAKEELFRQGLYVAANGLWFRPPIRTFLEERTQVLMHDHRTRYKMVVEGVMSIQAGEYPGLLDFKLRNFYLARKAEGGTAAASVRDLKERLSRTPFSLLDLDGIRGVMVDMAAVVRRHKILALKEIVDLVDDELLVQGLDLVMQGTDAGLVRRMLEIRMRTLLHQHETRYQMVTEGFSSIERGDNPRIIEQKLRNFYEL